MRILVLGGTRFLGRHFVEAALAGGHAVTLFNRGRTNPGLFPGAERVHGDRDGGLGVLAGRTWDAVVDPSGYFPRVVGASAAGVGEAWWCTRRHSPLTRPKRLVACMRAASSSSSPPNGTMTSTQVTHARSPETAIRTSSQPTDHGRELAKMFSQDREISSQPSSRCQPGWTQLTDTSWSQIFDMCPRSRASRAR